MGHRITVSLDNEYQNKKKINKTNKKKKICLEYLCTSLHFWFVTYTVGLNTIQLTIKKIFKKHTLLTDAIQMQENSTQHLGD